MTVIRTSTHPLAGPTSLEDFMVLLEARREAWLFANWPVKMPPLVSWFYMPEDDAWIIPPTPQEAAPAASKHRRGPEYHQRLLDAAEARLAEAQQRAIQAETRAMLTGLPTDRGAWSGITRSRRAAGKHAETTETARLAAQEARQHVKKLAATVAHHRANLARAIERNQP